MKRKFIIIGRADKDTVNGPGLIINGLIKNFKSDEYELVPLIINSEISKKNFLKSIIKTIKNTNEGVINVHTDGYMIPFVIYLISHYLKGDHYFLTIHGIRKIEEKYNNKKNNLVYDILEKILYRGFENVVCVSKMEAADIRSIYGRKKPIYVIPNATEASSNCMPKSDNNHKIKLILLGGLKKGKGIKESTELFIYLKKIGIDFVADIYGEDEGHLDFFYKTLNTKGLSKKVSYRGIQRNKQDLYDAIAISDFSINLSLYDTFNSAIAESLVLGCPCICSTRCGASYLIKQNENGIVVDLSNDKWMQQVADYIQSFFNDQSKRERIYKNRIEYNQSLSWESIVEEYLALGEQNK